MAKKLGRVGPIHIGHELLGSAQRSRLLLEKSPVCTKVLDLDFNLQYMSSAGISALNIDDVTSYYGKPYPFHFYPEIFRTNMTRNLQTALATNEVITQEGSTLDIDGNELWFESTIVPMVDEQGEDECIIVISVDITHRKKLEKELRKSHALFSQAEQMGKMGHWEWDVISDTLVACSEQYAAIFDTTIEQALNPNSDLTVDRILDSKESFDKEVVEFIHEDDRDRYKQVTEAAYDQKIAWAIEFRIVTRKGRILHVLELGEPVLDEKGKLIRTFGTLQNITERKETEERLNYQANHDALTGLINRREFEKRAGRLLSTIKPGRAEHALCFMDLDQFKIVNDSCGHTAGDEMLRQLGLVLSSTVRQRDTLARLGGDEFGLLMEHCSLDDAKRVVASILSAINGYHFSWEEKTFKVSISIGLVPITDATASVTALLQDADAACYLAKDNGRNRVHVHHAKDAEIAKRHGEMQWVTRLDQALEKDQFCLYAQAIESIDGGMSKHFELLLRMIDEKGGIILPGSFLPAAERYNMVSKLDSWVINHALNALVKHPVFVNQINFISINLSGPSLADATFLEFVIKRLQESGVSAEKI